MCTLNRTNRLYVCPQPWVVDIQRLDPEGETVSYKEWQVIAKARKVPQGITEVVLLAKTHTTMLGMLKSMLKVTNACEVKLSTIPPAAYCYPKLMAPVYTHADCLHYLLIIIQYTNRIEVQPTPEAEFKKITVSYLLIIILGMVNILDRLNPIACTFGIAHEIGAVIVKEYDMIEASEGGLTRIINDLEMHILIGETNIVVSNEKLGRLEFPKDTFVTEYKNKLEAVLSEVPANVWTIKILDKKGEDGPVIMSVIGFTEMLQNIQYADTLIPMDGYSNLEKCHFDTWKNSSLITRNIHEEELADLSKWVDNVSKNPIVANVTSTETTKEP